MRVSDHRFHRPTEDPDIAYVVGVTDRQQIPFSTALSILMNFSLARDHIRFGNVFNNGILDAIFFFVFLFLAQVFCIYLYLQCLTFDKSFSFSGIWSLAFGRGAAWIGRLILFLSFVETCFGTTGIFPSMVQPIILANWPNSPSLFLNIWVLHLVVPLLIIIPVLLLADLGSLRWPSFIGNVLLVASLVILVIDAIRQRATFSIGPDFCWWTGGLVATLDIFQITSCVPLTLILPDLLRIVDRPTPARTGQLIWAFFWLVNAIMVMSGFLTYASYYRWIDSAGMLVYELMDPHSGLTIVLQLTLLFSLLLTVAVIAWWQARSLTLFFVPDNSEWLANFLSGVTLILVMLMTSFVSPSIVSILVWISFVPRLLMLYVIPPVLYLKCFRLTQPVWATAAVIALLCGIIITGAQIYYSVWQYITAFGSPVNMRS
jgi:hypothetical protein